MKVSRSRFILITLGIVLTTLAFVAPVEAAYERSKDIPVDSDHPLGQPGAIAAVYGSIVYETFDVATNGPKLVFYDRRTGAWQNERVGLTMPTHATLPPNDPSPRLWAWSPGQGRFFQVPPGGAPLVQGPQPDPAATPFKEFAVIGSGPQTSFFVAQRGAVKMLNSQGSVMMTIPVVDPMDPTNLPQARVAASGLYLAVGNQATGQVSVYRFGEQVPRGIINVNPGKMHLDVQDANGEGDVLIGQGNTGTPKRFDARGKELSRPAFSGSGNPKPLHFGHHDDSTLYQFVVGQSGGFFTSYPPPKPPGKGPGKPCDPRGGVQQGTLARNRSPIATFRAASLDAREGVAVVFDASASRDPDGRICKYKWSFGDGSPRVSGSRPIAVHVFSNSGIYRVKLKVEDDRGAGRAVVQKFFVGRVSNRPPGSDARPISKIHGKINGKRLRKALRYFSGVTEASEGTEIKRVYLALGRKLRRGGCTWYKPVVQRFIRSKGCGGKYRRWFAVSRGPEWSFRLPNTVPMKRGLYQLNIRAVDDTGYNEHKAFGRNQVFFRIRGRGHRSGSRR